MDRADVDLAVFDILGTMVDEPGGIERELRAALPDLDDAGARGLAEVWLSHVEEQQREIVAGRRVYAASTELDLEAASVAVAAAGLDDPGLVASLAAAATRLDAWPDSVSGLGRIAAVLPVVGLSNASRAALARINAYAGLRWHLALSAEDARTYKPHRDVYRLAIDLAGVAPERLLMVAAHAWDLRGAQAAGMRTAYVARPVGDPPTATDSFDLVAGSLEELATMLGVPQPG